MSKDSKNGTLNGRTKAPRRRRDLTPSHPRMRQLVMGGTARLIFHEDRRERRALARLVKLQQEQADRLNEVCKLERTPGKLGTEFRAHIDYGDKTDLQRIAEPWRPGTRRQYLLLYGDRLQTHGRIDATIGTYNEVLTAEAIVNHLRKTAADCLQMADQLAADMKANPEAWQPLPTLGELLDGGKAVRA